jgi:hypothetical protein
MKSWWNNTEKGKPEIFGQKFSTDETLPAIIPYGLSWDGVRTSEET